MSVFELWKVVRKRLKLRPYRLQLLQALKPTNEILFYDNEDFLDDVFFSDY